MQKLYLFNLLEKKRLVTVLLFRGSFHGWNGTDFHSRCDNKGPTISLFKIKNGDCIGGFTKAQWSSSESDDDPDAFLFNLTRSRVFPSTAKGGIFCESNWGPTFDSGILNCTDLGALGEPFNGDGKCYSNANYPGYKIGVDASGVNMLTNKKDKYFTITELEVWQVTFIVINYICLLKYIGQMREIRDHTCTLYYTYY